MPPKRTHSNATAETVAAVAASAKTKAAQGSKPNMKRALKPDAFSDNDEYDFDGLNADDDDDDDDEEDDDDEADITTLGDEDGFEDVADDDEEEEGEENEEEDSFKSKQKQKQKQQQRQKQPAQSGRRGSNSSKSSSSKADTAVEDLGDDEDENDDTIERLGARRVFRTLRRMDRPEIDPVYASDDSDEETRNTIGNVPIEWYDDFPHIGYDVNGKKIMKPAKGDDLDAFLAAMDNNDTWRTVEDKMEGVDKKLTPEELDMLKRIHQQQFPDSDFDPYAPTIEWFTSKTEIMPLNAADEPKRRFIPSKHEAATIMKIARAIKKGLIRPPKKAQQSKSRVYDIWESAPEETVRPNHIPAPKMSLPEHLESYNPPAEYLLTPEEQEKWEATDPAVRTHNFIPKKYASLRNVPAYSDFVRERFERCLDLYLCPRTTRNKLDIDPESLIPKLPKPQDLQPFPTTLTIEYKGHEGRVRCLTIDPSGQWVATSSDDKTVRIWEVLTGRCVELFSFDNPVMAVSWNPNKGVSLICAATDTQAVLFTPTRINHHLQAATREIITDMWAQEKEKAVCEWVKPTDEESALGHHVHLKFPKRVTSLSWHRKGDYLATISPDSNSNAVQIHQISTGRSQTPFKKSKGMVQHMLFHPSKPIIFVATQRYVRVYNLAKQEMIRKLTPGAQWISSIDIHPGGDNLIIGTYDKKVHWFDLDLSSTPYKTLRFHKEAVREVAYHKRYPLMASSSDDGNVVVFHCMVYNDLMQNPLIVPVKTLRAHEPVKDLGALGCKFHPTQPWLFTCGADGVMRLFC